MRHASGTCTTIGIIKDIDDVFVSGVGEARAWAAPGEEASRDARWGRHAQAALRSLPCQAGTTGTNERAYLRCVGTRCAVTACALVQRQTGH
jgi:hypothetical protein